MFKDTNKMYNIECWKNRRECRTLPHIYICITGTKKKWIPEVLSWSTYKIVRKEVYNTVWKFQVSKNQGKHTVVQRKKEFHNIKCYYTILSFLAQIAQTKYIRKIPAFLVDY